MSRFRSLLTSLLIVAAIVALYAVVLSRGRLP